MDSPAAELSSSTTLVDPPLSESLVAASQPYVGRWIKLVSSTNWEKGRIIVEWRESLASQGLPITEYSDEAWARLVGGVTGQHAGRLRRVYQRFGQTREQFAGLYWSHFQAALDFPDAEMWLEGAKQSSWSVAQMREQRWETLGKIAADKPRAEDVIASETDEDSETARTSGPLTGEYADVLPGPLHDGPDFGDEPVAADRGSAPAEWQPDAAAAPPAQLVRPFEHLPDLPDDLAEAFDSLKLAILHHRADGWQQTTAADVLHVLDAFKALVTAPSAEAPF